MTQFFCNLDDNLIAVTDSRGNSTRYTYSDPK
ncbi:hypothetical protein [Synechococcus sp. PCC 7336]